MFRNGNANKGNRYQVTKIIKKYMKNRHLIHLKNWGMSSIHKAVTRYVKTTYSLFSLWILINKVSNILLCLKIQEGSEETVKKKWSSIKTQSVETMHKSLELAINIISKMLALSTGLLFKLVQIMKDLYKKKIFWHLMITMSKF